jgi:PAP_fibrillin
LLEPQVLTRSANTVTATIIFFSFTTASFNITTQTLTNRATYKGWNGLKTTVQLVAMFQQCEESANRLLVEFKEAMVDVGGLKLSFPHMGRFSPKGFLETTYVNDYMRIARGNKG